MELPRNILHLGRSAPVETARLAFAKIVGLDGVAVLRTAEPLPVDFVEVVAGYNNARDDSLSWGSLEMDLYRAEEDVGV